VFSLTKTSSRQREIVEILLSNGWDYMRAVLTGVKTGEPQIPTPEALKKILVELGPFFVKLGQLLSTRPDLLPPTYVEAFSALQENVPPVAWELIKNVIETEIKVPLDSVFQYINPEAIAAGSIGQIHQAILANGQQVAIKVLRPGIDKIVSQDSTLLKGIAELIALTEFGQTYSVVKLTAEFTNAVQAELDFRQEGRFTDQLRDNLIQSRWVDSDKLVVPQVYWEVSSEKVLVLEWLEGKPLLAAEVECKQEVTTLLFRAFFQQFYIDGFFHADPHPGNIFYLSNGQVALLDCGMVGSLDPRTRQILTELLLAIVDLDAQGCAQLTLKLSESIQPISLVQLEMDYEQMLRKYYNLNLSQVNFSEVVYEILQISRNNKIKLPGNLGLYAKSLANLEGSTRKFNPDVNILNEIKPLMTDLFRQQLVGDTPLQSNLRTILDLKSIYLKSPRLLEVFLERLTTETLNWNLRIQELEPLRVSLDSSANRLSFSIVIGSLIIGAAIISTGGKTRELAILSDILFTTASIIGLWLVVSILRSGRLR
jgi:predicted unusual protein kinase regulating ubiquinone biosynthesis (AarF/ABC1/UbiB family)